MDVAQSNPKVVYAQVEAKGAKGGLYRTADGGSSWTLVNSSQSLRARPFYFNKVFVSPKDENDVWVSELNFHHSTDGGKTFVNVNTPHGDNHVVWFNPDHPHIFIETNDGGANITQDNGKSWSSINNQPTAEMYMVDADEQFPYNIYGPQQDTGKNLTVPSLPPTSWGPDDPIQFWLPAPGCESGQVRPIPSGKIVYGDCKGEFGRMNVETGQEQNFWINPQQRYGKLPQDMMFRFVRQSPIEVDAHNPNIVYHGSQYVHKTIDGGVHWTKFSPDVTANGPEGHVMSGEPITRDMTGEEVYAALYSMRSSRLEPGVFWTGSNDGPVWMTRDNGKTWKNVTPAGLPPGGRVHTIEDSPHRKGSAYVSVYRMYLNDFKPYLYMTNDYGAHWTLLTDGTNGIPADQPMHVVREDPEQEGLLYAGTLQGAYVSFDQGKHWQTLQQNLPATPVTDFKVHHGDLVASTMGRAFWILDDVSPLRQIAASVTKPTRPRPTDNPNGQQGWHGREGRDGREGQDGQTRDVVLASQQSPQSVGRDEADANAFDGEHRDAAHGDGESSRSTARTCSSSRRRRPIACTTTPLTGRADQPEYPAAGARIDYYLREPVGRGEARDPRRGGHSRAQLLERGARAQPAAAAAARGGGLPSTLPTKVGMNRFVWDLRYPGGRGGGGDGEGGGFGGGGPLVAPGAFKARLTAGGVTKTESFTVKIDPRIAKDGVDRRGSRRADEVRAEGARRAGRGARSPGARASGAWRPSAAIRRSCRASWDRLTTKSGPYEDQMFVDQMSNVNREIARGRSEGSAPAPTSGSTS